MQSVGGTIEFLYEIDERVSLKKSVMSELEAGTSIAVALYPSTGLSRHLDGACRRCPTDNRHVLSEDHPPRASLKASGTPEPSEASRDQPLNYHLPERKVLGHMSPLSHE